VPLAESTEVLVLVPAAALVVVGPLDPVAVLVPTLVPVDVLSPAAEVLDDADTSLLTPD
jgi:hypothetical protein